MTPPRATTTGRPASRDSESTKRRILDAATAEFAEFGLSGARVDRIAAAATSNKRMIYVYFGNKEELFDIVVAQALDSLIDVVHLTPEDLPGYAGAMFDALVADPTVVRLSMWRQLERPQATASESESYATKLAALEEQWRDESGSPISWPTLLTMILSLAQTWYVASPALRSQLSTADALRGEVVEAATRLTSPLTPRLS